MAETSKREMKGKRVRIDRERRKREERRGRFNSPTQLARILTRRS